MRSQSSQVNRCCSKARISHIPTSDLRTLRAAVRGPKHEVIKVASSKKDSRGLPRPDLLQRLIDSLPTCPRRRRGRWPTIPELSTDGFRPRIYYLSRL